MKKFLMCSSFWVFLSIAIQICFPFKQRDCIDAGFFGKQAVTKIWHSILDGPSAPAKKKLHHAVIWFAIHLCAVRICGIFRRAVTVRFLVFIFIYRLLKVEAIRDLSLDKWFHTCSSTRKLYYTSPQEVRSHIIKFKIFFQKISLYLERCLSS